MMRSVFQSSHHLRKFFWPAVASRRSQVSRHVSIPESENTNDSPASSFNSLYKAHWQEAKAFIAPRVAEHALEMKDSDTSMSTYLYPATCNPAF